MEGGGTSNGIKMMSIDIDNDFPLTSHVKIVVDNRTDPKPRWILQTFSKDDARKIVGGDEFMSQIDKNT